MKRTIQLLFLPLTVLLVTSCTKEVELTLKERLHNDYLDVIEEDESDLRNLV